MISKKKQIKKSKSFFLDKFPIITIILILGLSVMFFFIVINRLPLDFFSGNSEIISEQSDDYDLYFESPSKNQEFELVNFNETVPINIKSKNIEELDCNIEIYINDKLVKTLEKESLDFNWSPSTTDSFTIYAKIIDPEGTPLHTSEKINFSVNFINEKPTESTTQADVDIEQKKNDILSKANYRTQNANPIFSYRCYTPPVIDSNLDDWEIYEKFTSFNPTIKKENYVNASDISGVFSSCWDEDNFYFFIKATDDVINQPFSGNLINNGDSIVLVFDAELEEDFNIPFLNGDDYQIEFSPGNNSGGGPESFVRWPSNSSLKNAVISAKKGSGGYTIEGSIPWFEMPKMDIKDETVVGFTISLLDTDNLDSTELVMSSSRSFDFNNVSMLGTLIFIDVGDIKENTETTQ
ncbi:MAG: sugar-binding protein [Actinomycetota bacterium]|nr:sugar-binding protein [Actinomycetota bacterium]